MSNEELTDVTVQIPIFNNGEKITSMLRSLDGLPSSVFVQIVDSSDDLTTTQQVITALTLAKTSMNASLRARPIFTRVNVWLGMKGEVHWIRDYSTNVATSWDTPIDFLFIDGDHGYEACLKDWTDWSPHVVSGGIVVFHDARAGASEGKFWDGFEGPTRVVNDFFRSNVNLEWELVDEARTCVAVRRRR